MTSSWPLDVNKEDVSRPVLLGDGGDQLDITGPVLHEPFYRKTEHLLTHGRPAQVSALIASPRKHFPFK
jgi:hypothetical protein